MEQEINKIMEKKHSNLPWHVAKQDHGVFLMGGDAQLYCIAKVDNEANAEFIVTAVNHHDELVDALRSINREHQTLIAMWNKKCGTEDYADYQTCAEVQSLLEKISTENKQI